MLALILEFAMKYSHGYRDYNLDDTMSCGSCETDYSMEGSETYSQAIVKKVDVVSFNSTGGGSVTPLNLIQQGVEGWNRIGRTVCLKRIQVAIHDTTLNFSGRAAIVYDRQSNGVLPTFLTIFNGYDQTGTLTGSPALWIHPDYEDRFIIVHQWFLYQPPSGVAGDSKGSVNMLEADCDLSGLLTQYKSDSNPAVIGDVATGALYFCDDLNFASFSGSIRTTFVDA